MKYTNEIAKKMIEDYGSGMDVKKIASDLGVPDRSVIAKLSSLGVYKRKVYTPVHSINKEECISRISKILNIDIDLLESMVKVNKTTLMLIVDKLKAH